MLADGRRISVPLSFYPTLLNASQSQRRKWDFWGPATAVEWPDFDLQLGVDDIAAGRREHIPPADWRQKTLADMKKHGIKPPPQWRD
ncbi:MAG: DUF2442 domain-containing protein [Phycisphaerales bacterium]|nr:DUF2442 domain-containing protein [Phycisphaerales bacterium]